MSVIGGGLGNAARRLNSAAASGDWGEGGTAMLPVAATAVGGDIDGTGLAVAARRTHMAAVTDGRPRWAAPAPTIVLHAGFGDCAAVRATQPLDIAALRGFERGRAAAAAEAHLPSAALPYPSSRGSQP